MNQQQQAFVVARLAGENATQAALTAGYSPATAYSQGSRLNKRPEIQQAIQHGQQAMQNAPAAAATVRHELAAAVVLAAEIATEAWIIDQAAEIVGIGMAAISVRDNKGRIIDGEYTSTNLPAAVAALNLLAKRHPAFAVKQEHSGPGGGPIPLVAAIATMTDDQLRRIVAERRSYRVVPERQP